jgi:hypothetical protein
LRDRAGAPGGAGIADVDVRKILLFLKKKKQKDFYFWRCGKLPAMAWILGAAEE